MKVKTAGLANRALDFAAKKARGDIGIIVVREGIWLDHDKHRYSTDWSQGGPLIAEAKMDFAHYKRFRADGVKEHVYLARHQPVFTFQNYSSEMAAPIEAEGLTHLVAACRCYVLWKLGAEVDIPEELA